MLGFEPRSRRHDASACSPLHYIGENSCCQTQESALSVFVSHRGSRHLYFTTRGLVDTFCRAFFVELHVLVRACRSRPSTLPALGVGSPSVPLMKFLLSQSTTPISAWAPVLRHGNGRLPATAFGIPFSYGRRANNHTDQPLLSHRMPICHIGVARSTGFEPVSRTFVGWYTIHCANRVYIKLTGQVFRQTGLELRPNYFRELGNYSMVHISR